jgi:hypothetical protein
VTGRKNVFVLDVNWKEHFLRYSTVRNWWYVEFLCSHLNTLILQRGNLKKKSGYSRNILDAELIGGVFHLDVLKQLSSKSSLQTASSSCEIIVLCASSCHQYLAYSTLGL